ncbi:MAG TPA: CRTAC1 family protein [Saprospiraceae bacterium]|nr:CRTAC1 family protein [Saprospiraceae bacterium]
MQYLRAGVFLFGNRLSTFAGKLLIMYRCLFVLVSCLLLWQCSGKKSAPGKTAKTPQNGHEKMIAILDSISQYADPNECYNLNAKKAALIKQQYDSAPARDKLTMQLRYADQILRAGKNEAAIMEFQDIINKLGDQLTQQSKPVYELLALAYLRLGEQQNCINTHTSESCILPIQGGGVYKMTSGPESAVKIYERVLKDFPDDEQVRWLLNLAYMTLGKWPDSVPKDYLIPQKVFQAKGDIKFKDIAIPMGLDTRGLSGGVCMEDFNNDGHLDLFVTSYGLRDQCRYYQNNGDGSFTERTKEANLTGILSGLSTNHADFDNDGDRDILVLRGGWLLGGTHPNSLLRNNGDGTFTDITIESGLLSFHPTQAADWADFDGDGWLDLFIANETQDAKRPHPCELFRNNGNGTFTNIASKLHLDFVGFFKAATWGDLNNDQRPDLYISNLYGDNKLLVNRGGSSPEAWVFEDMAKKAGTTGSGHTFPSFFFDYDNDGLDDIFCSDYSIDLNDQGPRPYIKEILGKQPPGSWISLYHNLGNEKFENRSKQAGLNTITYAMGNNFGDLDNDGWTDIYLGTGKPDLSSLIPNRMFRNVNGQRFEDITMNGFGQIQKGHGVAFGDLDNDGDQDIYVVVGGALEGDLSNNILLENPGTPHHWITVFCEGKSCNRDAIGAKIKVNTVQKDGKKQSIWATVGTGGSFGAASLRQEIGLGDATRIESVEVTWPKPGLAPSVYTNISLDSHIKLVEGAGSPEPINLPTTKFRI